MLNYRVIKIQHCHILTLDKHPSPTRGSKMARYGSCCIMFTAALLQLFTSLSLNSLSSCLPFTFPPPLNPHLPKIAQNPGKYFKLICYSTALSLYNTALLLHCSTFLLFYSTTLHCGAKKLILPN